MAWATLVGDNILNKEKEINNTNFQKELNNNGNDTTVSYVDNDPNKDFLVTFNDTLHQYLVDKNGNIKLVDNAYIAKETDEINNYVKDGLILWYDGIKNTKAGNNPNATSWEDLSGNNNDGIFSNAMVAKQSDITGTSKGYYDVNEQGYVFLHNDAYIESVNKLGIEGDDNYTVEIIMNPYTNKKNPNYSTASDNSAAALWFGTTSSSLGKFVMFGLFRNTSQYCAYSLNNGTRSVSIDSLLDNNFSISYRKIKQGKINNGDRDVYKMVLNGIGIPSAYSSSSYTSDIVNSKAFVGRNWQYGGENRPFYGSIQSIRIYNRVLTDEEIEKNYELDKKRFNVVETQIPIYPIEVNATSEYSGRTAWASFDGIYKDNDYSHGWQCTDSTTVSGSYIEFSYNKAYEFTDLEIYVQGFAGKYLKGKVQAFIGNSWKDISQETDLIITEKNKITKYTIPINTTDKSEKYRVYFTSGSSSNWYGINISELVPHFK